MSSFSVSPFLLSYLTLFTLTSVTECHVRFHVALRVPRFVELGGSAMLFCEHGVARDQLHKVEWLRDGRKLFQYVRGRSPPFRNYSTPGADLDWTHTNERQVMLRNLNFEASGSYSCEVSTETPIYTKPSNDEMLTVILKQRSDPVITGRKPGIYTPGERLELNCTSSPSRPEADITWLINGHKVDEYLVRVFPGQRTMGELYSCTVQLTLELTEAHALQVAGPGGHQLLQQMQPPPSPSNVVPSGQLHVTCMTTIPAFRGLEEEENHMHPGAFRYADLRTASVVVEVIAPLPSPDPAAAATSETSGAERMAGSMLPLLVFVLQVTAR